MTMTIGEVATHTGLTIDTLRLYEREGLLTAPVKRSHSGRRDYSEGDVAWLVTCRLFRASGMPLATIRRFAELVREGEGNEGQRLALLRDHQRHIDEQRAALDACHALISSKVEIYERAVADGAAGGLWT